jgi:hypothetical protein
MSISEQTVCSIEELGAGFEERSLPPLGNIRALAPFELDLVGGAASIEEVLAGAATVGIAVAAAVTLPATAPIAAGVALCVAAGAGGAAVAHGLFG